MLLVNVWLNPMVYPVTPDEMERKCRFLQHYIRSQGIEAEIISEEAVQKMREYTALHTKKMAETSRR